jgi:uncharacterized protein with FMN-binding domain
MRKWWSMKRGSTRAGFALLVAGTAVVVGALLTNSAPGAGAVPPATQPGTIPVRTKAEVDKLIDEAGRTAPSWWDSTPLTIPPGVDLSWTGGARTVTPYIFNNIFPNPGRWGEGVKLLQHSLTLVKDKDKAAAQQNVSQLITMLYTKMLRDYARGAFWARRLGGQQGDTYLVECYLKLGCRDEALNLLTKLGANKQPNPMLIMLCGELGDAKTAMQWGEDMARNSQQPVFTAMIYLAVGDACRQVGDVPNTLAYYGKVLAVATDKGAANQAAAIKRFQGFAQTRLDATKLIDGLDLNKIPDGTYKDTSIGYVGPIEVTLTVKDHHIQSVMVSNHKENRAYSSITEVPQSIMLKQSLKGVDMVSGATITSAAIINASAKALAGAQK